VALWSYSPIDPDTLGIWSHKTFIHACYYNVLAMIVREPTKPKRKLIPVKYYLRKEEFTEIKKIVFLMYKYEGIARPTMGAFAKAACYKLYNDINQVALNEAGGKRD
jgi:hypothetical protein